ncbi:hypothetical protein [Kitasatospora sp. NPDC057500]|uniref:hypothetical protein n=1 Tax=Kitasatospora sp. NPDC057500 TaxID=3346151 RepID=UPI00367D22B7
MNDMTFADDQLTPLVDTGPGNSPYLLDLGNGRALAVLAGGPQDRARATGHCLEDGT